MLYGFPTFQLYLGPYISSLPSPDPAKLVTAELELENSSRSAIFNPDNGWPLAITLELSSFYSHPDKIKRERFGSPVISKDPKQRAKFLSKLKTDLKTLFSRHKEVISDAEIDVALRIFESPDHPLAMNLYHFTREKRVLALFCVYLLARKYQNRIIEFQRQLKLFIGKDTDRSCFGDHGFYRQALALCTKNDVYDQCAAIAILIQQERRGKDLTFLSHTTALIEAACQLFLDAIDAALTKKKRAIDLALLHNDALNEFITLYNEAGTIIDTLAITDRMTKPKETAELAYQLLLICSGLFDRIQPCYELGEFFRDKDLGLKDTFKAHFNPASLRAACQSAFDRITTSPADLDPSTPAAVAITPPRPAACFFEARTRTQFHPVTLCDPSGTAEEEPAAADPVAGDGSGTKARGVFIGTLGLMPSPTGSSSLAPK